MMDNQTYGTMIRTRREEMSLGVKDMLGQINPVILDKVPSKSAIAHIEAGHNWPSYQLAAGLALVLNEPRLVAEYKNYERFKFDWLEIARRLIAEHWFEEADILLDGLLQHEEPLFHHEAQGARLLVELYIEKANITGMNLWSVSKLKTNTNNTANPASRKNRLIGAMSWLNKGEKLAHSTGMPVLARTKLYLAKADIYYRNFMFEECIEYCRRVGSYIQNNEGVHFDTAKMNTFNLVSRANYRLGDIHAGDYWYKRFSECVSREEDPLMHANILTAKIKLLMSTLNYKEACELGEDTLELCALEAKLRGPQHAFSMSKWYLYAYLLVLAGRSDEARKHMVDSVNNGAKMYSISGQYIGEVIEEYYLQRFNVTVDILTGATFDKYENHLLTWKQLHKDQDFVIGGVDELSAVGLLNQGDEAGGVHYFKKAIAGVSTWACKQDVEALIRRAERYTGIAFEEERLLYLF